MLKLYLKFAVYRIMSVILIRTFFVPDEYWQSLEPAHFHSFGYGYKTWEYREGIRNYFYTFIFCSFYKLLSLLRLDSLDLIIHGPRIIQALLSAFADVHFYRWCKSFNFSTTWIVLTIITDWFGFYCSSRTLINTLETNLVAFGLCLFPWADMGLNFHFRKGSLRMFITLVCFSVYVRPTALVVWMPFCIFWFFNSTVGNKKSIILNFLFIGVVISAILVVVDSIFYRSFTITPWNFFKFNLMHGISSFYGTHPFHWYYSQGIPVVLGFLLFPFIFGMGAFFISLLRGGTYNLMLRKINLTLCFTIWTAVFLLSCIPHKEFRFIWPLSPMMQFFALQSLNAIGHKRIQKVYAAASLSTFIGMTLFFGLIHQRGTLSVMEGLAADARLRPNHTSILLLTPCHATPLYSHLHVNVPVKFIQCEPPIKVGERDESQHFFSDPLAWLQHYWEINPPPTHIVMFDSLSVRFKDYFTEKFYVEQDVYFHTIFPDERTGKFVVIYRRRDWLG